MTDKKDFLAQLTEDDKGALGYLVIASVPKDVTIPLAEAETLYSELGFQDYLPSDKKLSNIWERCTNVSTVPRKDIEFANEFKSDGFKVRFYTAKIKGDLGKTGTMSRHLVMEIINPSQSVENSHDIGWEDGANEIAKAQRVSKAIAIMKFDNNDSQKYRFYWTGNYAKSGHGYLAEGEAARVVGEIKTKIESELLYLTNREIWKTCKAILKNYAAYPLTTRGSAYFVPSGFDPDVTKKTLKNFMDLINRFKSFGKASCTIWEVNTSPKGDYFGSCSEVLTSSLMELSERIDSFTTMLAGNKREKTIQKEWSEIQNHVGIFKSILGNKLGEIEESLKNAVSGITGSPFTIDLDDSITEVMQSYGEIDIPHLEIDMGDELAQVEDNGFEVTNIELSGIDETIEQENIFEIPNLEI